MVGNRIIFSSVIIIQVYLQRKKKMLRKFWMEKNIMVNFSQWKLPSYYNNKPKNPLHFLAITVYILLFIGIIINIICTRNKSLCVWPNGQQQTQLHNKFCRILVGNPVVVSPTWLTVFCLNVSELKERQKKFNSIINLYPFSLIFGGNELLILLYYFGELMRTSKTDFTVA